MKIVWRPVAQGNYTDGRGGKRVELIVVHWIVGDLAAADAVFSNSSYGTSAHYAVGETVIHQYVSEKSTAHHAGNWDVNQRSIGIEHRGGPNLPITDSVYKNSAELIIEIAKRHSLPINSQTVRPHNAFKQTQCPGTLDVARLIRMANEILNPGGSTGDTIPVEKRTFEELVGKATKYDAFVSAGFPDPDAVKKKIADLEKRPDNSTEVSELKVLVTSLGDQVAKREAALQYIQDYIERLKVG